MQKNEWVTYYAVNSLISLVAWGDFFRISFVFLLLYIGANYSIPTHPSTSNLPPPTCQTLEGRNIFKKQTPTSSVRFQPHINYIDPRKARTRQMLLCSGGDHLDRIIVACCFTAASDLGRCDSPESMKIMEIWGADRLGHGDIPPLERSNAAWLV